MEWDLPEEKPAVFEYQDSFSDELYRHCTKYKRIDYYYQLLRYLFPVFLIMVVFSLDTTESVSFFLRDFSLSTISLSDTILSTVLIGYSFFNITVITGLSLRNHLRFKLSIKKHTDIFEIFSQIFMVSKHLLCFCGKPIIFQ